MEGYNEIAFVYRRRLPRSFCLAEITNFDALMNAGLNVPRLINLADHGARKAKEEAGHVKKNYTGNHLQAWIIAIDEQRIKHRLLYAEIYVPSKIFRK